VLSPCKIPWNKILNTIELKKKVPNRKMKNSTRNTRTIGGKEKNTKEMINYRMKLQKRMKGMTLME